MDEITIELPLPDKRLSPNRPPSTRGGRMAQHAAAKRMRERAMIEGLASLACRAGWRKARATAAFFWPDRRRRDIRNAEASLKPYYDGLVDAEIIIDDNSDVLRHGETRFDLDPHDPRVEITIERLQ